MSEINVAGRRVWLRPDRRGGLIRYAVTLPSAGGHPAVDAGIVYQVEILSRRMAPYWEAADAHGRRVTIVPLRTRRDAVEMLVRAVVKP